MDVEVQNRKECVGIALPSIAFDRRANEWLGKYKIREQVEVEERSIGLEELSQQTFDPMPVDVSGWIEELKIDVYEILG